VKQITVDAVAI